MTRNSRRISLPLLAFGLLASSSYAVAGMDGKPISVATCQPYMKNGASQDLTTLSIGPEGIASAKTTHRVFCPLLKDSEEQWDQAHRTYVIVDFWRPKDGTAAPITHNRCTISVGRRYTGGMKSHTLQAFDLGGDLVDHDYGSVIFDSDEGTIPKGSFGDPASLVCDIAAGSTLESIYMREDANSP